MSAPRIPWMDHLVHPSLLRQSGRRVERYRVLARVLLLMFCMCALGASWLLIHDQASRALASAAAAAGLLGSAWLLRRGWPSASAVVTLGILAVLTTVLALLDGGIYSSSPAWLPVLALIGTATLGRLGGVVYAAVLVVLIGLVAFSGAFGIPVVEVSSTPMGRMSAVVGLVACGVAVVFWWSAERDRHLARVEALAQERDAQAFAAEQAARAKIRFLETMSHELRTPLNHVLGSAREMARSSMSPDLRRALVELHGGAEALGAMIDDVLDVIALGDGSLHVEVDSFSPVELAKYAADRWGRVANERGLDLRLELAQDLPAHVAGDRRRILQILAQILDNAVRYTPWGHIQVTVDAVDGGLRFRVDDTGPGVAEADAERIFQAFEQGEGVHRASGGRGLGLTLGRGIAEHLGGTLVVDRSYREGARFVLTLPLPTAEPKPVSPLLFAGARVLVVDDSPLNRKIVRNVLERRGLVVEEAAHGQAAVDRVQELPPDLILMDIEMPILDGYGATRALRDLGFGLPVVALSAHTLPDAVARGRAAGMDAHLGKPVDPEAVCSVLARWIPPARSGEAAPELADVALADFRAAR